MAQNKKPRKKYTPKYSNKNEVAVFRINMMFQTLYKFFGDLKNGKADVFRFDDIGYVPYVVLEKEIFAAYIFLQIFCEYTKNVLTEKNINLDYSPIYDFANYLCQRNDNLYFDVSEINKAYAFVLKVHNIFRKEIDVASLLKGVEKLEKSHKTLKYKMNGVENP